MSSGPPKAENWLHLMTPSLETITTHAGQYLGNVRRLHPRAKLAVSFDIDDTILRENPKRQTVIKVMQNLYATARKLNYAVFFITARRNTPENMANTKKQLQRTGFGDYTDLFLMPSELRDKGLFCEFKYLMRHKIEQDGYQIVLNVGDSWHDLLVHPEKSTHPHCKSMYKILKRLPPDNYILFSAPDTAWLSLKMVAQED